MKKEPYDVVIVGGGHAGCEAALASSRMGCRTLLVTMHFNTVGLMSCNPAIGGIGKGQLVKEIDALGGEMGRAADASGIQFKILNASKGPAVHSSRAQVDRKKFRMYMRHAINIQENLQVYEAEITGLIVEKGAIKGVSTDKGDTIFTRTAIIAPGTFLNGLIHIGMESFPGGRIEEMRSSRELSDCLRDLNFRMLRFKTGTCARLDGKTIDFSTLGVQNGDARPRPFSFSTKEIAVRQVPCYVAYTNEATHEIVRKNLDGSPLFSGKITGTGVRYCPSLEDKVVKFPHHRRHQIFLEPEGLEADEYYPNGLSTSLPKKAQSDFIRSIPGLENAAINRYGYGIEHDAVDPTQLLPTLETRAVKNLYLAGQINGTTGYEEAAAQGLMAGINAALRVKDRSPLILDRSTSYIGVLIDDLVVKGTNEPYRMFTSRVEYRLILREDNADLRLRKSGFDIGLVSEDLLKKAEEKKKRIQEGIELLKRNRVSGNGGKPNLYQLLKRPAVKIKDIRDCLPSDYSEEILRGIEIEVKYTGFIKRQFADVKDFRYLEKINIPSCLDYNKVPGLSLEIIDKLSEHRPFNLGQAGRISGVTPAAVSILMAHVRKLSAKNKK